MKAPPRWTPGELAVEVNKSAAIFRASRLADTEQWMQQVAVAESSFEKLFMVLGDLAPGKITDAAVAQAFKDDLSEAMRYLAGPFISSDDLKVVAEVPSISPSRLGSNHDMANKAFSVIKAIIDPHRFPWVKENRAPTAAERTTALVASSVLLASSRVGTGRRTTGKTDQEAAVTSFLLSKGFNKVPTRKISTLMKGPETNEFCGESKLGNRKADIVVRLRDTRLMPIECKVSNSATNSVKRINNDAAAKAESWNKAFGTEQVVPTAVIGGVFKVSNLMQAQESGLTLFWAHDLEKLGDFIDQTA